MRHLVLIVSLLAIFAQVLVAAASSLHPTASPVLPTFQSGYIIETTGVDPKAVIDELFLAVLDDDDEPSLEDKKALRRRVLTETERRNKTVRGVRVEGFIQRPLLPVNGRSLQKMENEFIGLIHVESDEDLERLRNSSHVLSIIRNDEIHLAEVTSNWNLDRIDQAFGMDGTYSPSKELGRNVDIYIVDTGVLKSHPEFSEKDAAVVGVSRVLNGASFVPDDPVATLDCNSHGTHVASIAAGNTFGIARQSRIIPVKMMDCAGRGYVWTFIQAAGWIIESIRNRSITQHTLAVVNLSLESPANTVIDRAVKEMVDAGAFVTVAAGNSNEDACNISPARESSGYTVGSLSMDDSKASSSNFGKCVNAYAPGERIVGAFPLDGKSVTKSGTSMASPLAAGIAATLRERFPAYPPLKIASEMKSLTAPVSTTFDEDCKGPAPNGALILQSLGARTKSAFNMNQLVLTGNLRNDFDMWSPDMVLPSLTNARPKACFQFSAQLTSTASSQKSGLSLMLSTANLPLGLSPLLAGAGKSNSTPCPARNSDWIIIESTSAGTTQLKFAGSFNIQGNTIAESGVHLPLSSENSVQATVTLQQLAKKRIRIQFSYENGFDAKGAPRVVVLMDAVKNMPPGLKNKPLMLSFKGIMAGEIRLQNIMACASPAQKKKNTNKANQKKAAKKKK